MARVLYTAEATVTGGRADGHGKTSDGALEVDLRAPTELGGEGGGTNPEQLFAVGYAACFESALGVVARRRRPRSATSRSTRSVKLMPTEDRGFELGVELHVSLPSVDDAETGQGVRRRARTRSARTRTPRAGTSTWCSPRTANRCARRHRQHAGERDEHAGVLGARQPLPEHAAREHSVGMGRAARATRTSRRAARRARRRADIRRRDARGAHVAPPRAGRSRCRTCRRPPRDASPRRNAYPCGTPSPSRSDTRSAGLQPSRVSPNPPIFTAGRPGRRTLAGGRRLRHDPRSPNPCARGGGGGGEEVGGGGRGGGEGWRERAFVYLLRCDEDSLYCGWTTDVERRLAAHRARHASRYTRSRLGRSSSRPSSRWPIRRRRCARRRGSSA